jgi:sulfoxide reductase heme-binding subunit YedZ
MASVARRLASPVLTRGGRFSALKTFVLALLFVPGLWLGAQYLGQDLGARPVLALVHGTGLWALRLLVITLALSPARALLDWPQSNAIRRMLGVGAACYAGLHLTLYCAQQNWHLPHVAGEILHRFYLTLGFVALLLLLTLAATSTDRSVRRLGRNWKRLHRLAYAAAVLGLVHYFLQAKAEVYQAVILAGLFVWLMAWRLVPARLRAHPALPAVLGAIAVGGAALVEYVWYATATHVDAARVFLANFRLAHWRPSIWVGVWCLAALGAVPLIRAAAGFVRSRGKARTGAPPLDPAGASRPQTPFIGA